MKKMLILISVITLLTFGVVLAQEVRTITGEVIDVSCYVAEGARGAEHKDCALACIQAGEPAAILEEGTDKVYVVITADHSTNPAKKILPYIAKTVEVTGTVNERTGISTIDIKDIKEIGTSSMGMPKEGMGMMEEGMGMTKEKKGMGGY